MTVLRYFLAKRVVYPQFNYLPQSDSSVSAKQRRPESKALSCFTLIQSIATLTLAQELNCDYINIDVLIDSALVTLHLSRGVDSPLTNCSQRIIVLVNVFTFDCLVL